jgi:hypothetical protein
LIPSRFYSSVTFNNGNQTYRLMTNDQPVFVVGVFRSGTSLLCSLLNQNPQIALMYEADVWNFPRPLLRHRFKLNWAERIEFFNQTLSRHRMVLKNDLSSLRTIHTPMDLYRAYGETKGAAVCGEKSPFYGNRLEQLYSLYPNAFFILVWRNPVEVYRSVLKAGQTSRFFGKPGMLSRMICHQEQAIRQGRRIERKGARICRVDYAKLVDQTESVCREISAFLGVPYDTRMVELNKADLSTIYRAPHHAYLRRGIIERQKYPEELVSRSVAKKLDRYRHRWERLQGDWLKTPPAPDQTEPGWFETLYHDVVGKTLTLYDSLVRAGFEFLPLPWLRVYRLLKNWVVNPPTGDADEKTSLFRDFVEHWQTIFTATALLAIVAFVHAHANPHLMFTLFYGVPCALVALVVGNRWATLFVVAGSALPPIIQFDGDPVFQSSGVFLWNLFSRFILLEIMALTLGRIRLEFNRAEKQEMMETEKASPVPTRLVGHSTDHAKNGSRLKFSIVTPSFRSSNWLKLCIASVADQQNVDVEHIVQDSCSDDGTQEWLAKDSRVKAFIEKDAGMYDAVNRGYRRASGDILAYLNCDEQYLPGALKSVHDFFEANPQVEVLLSGAIVTDASGKYLCHRHALMPDPHHIWFRFNALTSSIFIRRKVITERGLFFDTEWRVVGDLHWVRALMNHKVPIAVSDSFTSVFTDSGDNLGLSARASQENQKTASMMPAWVRNIKPLLILQHRYRRLAAGHFNLEPMSYSLYTLKSPDQRVTIDVPKPTGVWWNRI